MQPKDRRLVTEQNLEAYTESEVYPVRDTAKSAASRSTQALANSQEAMSQSGNAVIRVEQLETVGGLAPGEVTDAQTANLLHQPGSSTRAAFGRVTSEIAVTRKPLVFDTFSDVPDGEIPEISDSGHTWNYLHATRLQTQDGYISVKDGQGGVYTEINLENPVTRIGCTFMLDSEGGLRTEGGGVALNSWNDGGIAANGGGRRSRAHVDMNRTSLGWGIRTTEGVGEPINVTGGRYYFNEPLPLDEWMTFEWYIQGDKGVVLCPDGTVHTIEDDRLLTLDDNFACWQISGVQNQDSVRTKVRQIWADSSQDSPDDAQALAFKAASLANDPANAMLRPGQGLRTVDAEGNEREILVQSNIDTVILKNESAPEANRHEVHLRADGSVGIRNAATGISAFQVRPDGMVQIMGRLSFNTAGHGIMLGSGSPDGEVDAPNGMLYIDRSAGRGLGLWQKAIAGPNNTGWEQVGHPYGYTSQRPQNPPTGLSYFDSSLGRPIWWDGSNWVDVTGSSV